MLLKKIHLNFSNNVYIFHNKRFNLKSHAQTLIYNLLEIQIILFMRQGGRNYNIQTEQIICENLYHGLGKKLSKFFTFCDEAMTFWNFPSLLEFTSLGFKNKLKYEFLKEFFARCYLLQLQATRGGLNYWLKPGLPVWLFLNSEIENSYWKGRKKNLCNQKRTFWHEIGISKFKEKPN